MAGQLRPGPKSRGPRTGLAPTSGPAAPDINRAAFLDSPRPVGTNARNQELGYASNTLLTVLSIVAVAAPFVGQQTDRAPQRAQPQRQEATASQPLTLMLPPAAAAAAPFFSDEEDERPARTWRRIDDPQGRPLVLYALRDVQRASVIGDAPHRLVQPKEDLIPLNLSLNLVSVAPAPFVSVEVGRYASRPTPRTQDVAGDPMVLYAPPGPRIQGQETAARAQPIAHRVDEPSSSPLTLRAPPGPTVFGQELGRPQCTKVGHDEPIPLNLSLYAAAAIAPFVPVDVGQSPGRAPPRAQDPSSDPLVLLLPPAAAAPFTTPAFEQSRTAAHRIDEPSVQPLPLLAPPGPRIQGTEELPRAQSQTWRTVDPLPEPLTLRAPPGPTVFGQELARPQPIANRLEDPLPLNLSLNLVGVPPFVQSSSDHARAADFYPRQDDPPPNVLLYGLPPNPGLVFPDVGFVQVIGLQPQILTQQPRGHSRRRRKSRPMPVVEGPPITAPAVPEVVSYVPGLGQYTTPPVIIATPDPIEVAKAIQRKQNQDAIDALLSDD